MNLCHGVPREDEAGVDSNTCTAGAGTLMVEFTLLSRLLGDPMFEGVARKAVRALWDRRHWNTGLVGEENFSSFSGSLQIDLPPQAT